MSIRIAKAMADAGVCSRREAEALILQRRVEVNNETLDTPAVKVEDDDVIKLDGEIIRRPKATAKPKLWILHKPKGCLVTTNDPQGRETIFNLLPKEMPRVVAVGRLDFNTEGLLLLTNSGAYARELELPKNNQKRVYRVRVHGQVTDYVIDRLKQGAKIDGVHYKPIKLKVDREQPTNTWVTMTLTEGKNREIRTVMEFFGHPVSRLIRIAYGEHRLGSLPLGQVIAVK